MDLGEVKLEVEYRQNTDSIWIMIGDKADSNVESGIMLTRGNSLDSVVSDNG